jgi:hypothetical protein
MTAHAYQIVSQSPAHLVISVPGASLLSGWIALALIVFLGLMIYTTSRSVRTVYSGIRSPEEVASLVMRYRLIGCAIAVGALGLFWLCAYSSGSIDLDRSANRAVMSSRMTAFLPAQTHSVPLDAVEQAILDTKPNASRIRLLVTHGNDLAYPMWSDRGGQQEAVDAINRFLAKR